MPASVVLQQPDIPIAAIATPVGVGALAIVRMSGKGVFGIADRAFRKKSGKAFSFEAAEGFTAHVGTLFDGEGMVDEVVALVFRAPSSFTMEDMVEFTCHGGPVVVRRVLAALLDGGCRLAEPGEFTRRAFLNGRIDLLQAEAIGEMIHARTDGAFRTAVTQMQGGLSRRLLEMREGLLQSCALLELELDFSEEDVEFQSREELRGEVIRLQTELSGLVDSYQHGRLLSEGVSTVIAGRPNAGKSTLLNKLLGEERSIVSHMPGTTRDYIEECFVYDKTMFRLTDTAGLRESEEDVEHEGIERSYRKISEADLILYMLDVSGEGFREEAVSAAALCAGHPEARMILLANKTDLVKDSALRIAALETAAGSPVVPMAARSGEGIEELKLLMASMVEGLDKLHEASVLVTSLRHYEALRNASDALHNALGLIEGGEATELIAFELRSALDYVGEITGKVVSEELLNTIFGQFCIGK
ncbi:tRNA uridine-5-carboxymethylaminomethyl(34) synthesis GTPase MnmE [Pelodictyon luteolum]|uniref:tRNA modification GTPase MnmE n=1 Tax=Chlorobium luteolum (strain DSM 273 / BCRC 81028 / 2530) TaxID=319225 RepID=MNME_CHLL3|nr:tRNA uridine-5-carboxymethylaminomethyl(34) synthesis GTPase MnmE [Pelodictyon luteolum]Q3B1B4.1 RecName: Full=tRNA modification GTPase MnmE [Pelodictyon luteolum DSM 273]ABB24867.1 tRNA modification GTPase trmE [Pelodictyon luteolum DSM 273]